MAKKKKHIEKPKREFTKRQLSRWQQQKRRQRIIFGSGILIVVAVLAVVGAGVYFGWYVQERQPLQETVIEVNGTEFNMDYYLKTLKYQIIQLESMGIHVEIEQMPFLADEVVTSIQRNELMRQAAVELGITVSDEEIDEELASQDLPLSNDYRDLVRVGLLQQKLFDEYFDQQVPQTAEQRHIWAMFLESQSQVNEVKDRIETGEDFSELATELSLDGYSKSQKGDLGWQSREILPMLIDSPVLEESAFSIEVGVLSEPIPEETKVKMMGYWLVEVEFVDEEVRNANIKMMLLSSEEEANDIRARLEDGEDFAALAEEFSQHDESRESGGEFKVTAENPVALVVDEFIFDPELELGTLSQPIRDDAVFTEGGYWLIKVTEADDDRQLEEEDRNRLKSKAFNEWGEELWNDPDNNVVSYLDEEKKEWAVMHAWEG